MEPQIQYAKTSDGVSIAYWTLGRGKPLIFMPRMPISHIQAEWQVGYRALYERLADRRMLIRYDNRGSGLSERNVSDHSLAAHVRDIEAIVDCLDVPQFDVLGYTHSGPAAITYAAHHPERVAHLILWQSWVKSADITESARFEALMGILQTDWELFRKTASQVFYDWDTSEAPRRFAAFMGECMTHEEAKRAYAMLRSIDVKALLPKVAAPTLIMQVRGADYPGIEVARELTANIPDAHLALIDGASMAPFQNDVEATVRAIEEFTSSGEIEATFPEGMAVIFFADIVESTALTEKLGDAAFREKARELDEALRKIIRETDGTPVEGKLLGDGVLSVFSSAKNAIDAALRFEEASESVGLRLHLGIHAGDVIREEGNVFGGAVNIAARISSESEAGEVLVSQTVRDLARTSAGVSFEDRGERELKGVGEPVRLYAVKERD